MEYRLSKKRIRGKDLRLAQSGDYESNLRLVASCMIDPTTGDYMDKTAAFDWLDNLDVETQDEEVDKFIKALEAYKADAVPLAKDTR